MDEKPTTIVEHYDHLGLIAAIFNEYGVTERINTLIPKRSNNQKVTHAQAIQAMIYQGLGFSQKRLYSAKQFFSGTPIQQLLGLDVSLDMLNDKVLGRALDAVYAYGPTKFFSDIAFKTLIDNQLLSDFVHLDSTTHSFHGRHYRQAEQGSVTIGRGHSKGRKDLIQLVQLLVTTESGLPFWQQTCSGNASDKEIFQRTIEDIQTYVKQVALDVDIGFVSDSALYSKKFLLNKNITGDWISRVPESIKKASDVLEKDHDLIEWTKINKDFTYWQTTRTYGGVRQRWIIVRNRESKYKELATLKLKIQKEEDAVAKTVAAINNKQFNAKETIEIQISRLKKRHPLFEFRSAIIRKSKNKQPTQKSIFYKCILFFNRNHAAIKKLENKKGKFIIATNKWDNSLSAEKIIELYCGRNKNIEGCFKQIKDSTFRLNEIFLKRVDRIEALMSIMALSLFVNNLGQMILRNSLKENGNTIPDQKGRPTQNPTLKWAFQSMNKVIRLTMKLHDNIYQEFIGLNKIQRQIVECFGPYAKSLYGFP